MIEIYFLPAEGTQALNQASSDGKPAPMGACAVKWVCGSGPVTLMRAAGLG